MPVYLDNLGIGQCQSEPLVAIAVLHSHSQFFILMTFYSNLIKYFKSRLLLMLNFVDKALVHF